MPSSTLPFRPMRWPPITSPGSSICRLDKPYQLDDKIEQLFLEKSMTGAAAFNRLFDETMASLTFTIDGEELPLEVTLSMLQDADPETRRKAAEALTATFKANLRIFTLITNTLAKDKEISDRWRGFDRHRRQPASRQPRRARGGRRAGGGG